MLAGWIPWKWIVCGCDPAFTKLDAEVSPSVARITGPGAVPLYVHAGKMMPGAISMSLSSAVSVYSAHATRPVGSGGRRVEEGV